MTPPAFSPGSGRRPRVALAINRDERTLFLDHALPRLAAAAEVVEPAADGALMAELDRMQPQVVITAWSTPWLDAFLSEPARRPPYICHLVGSVRNVVPRTHVERGGLVTNWGPAVGQSVAEHALLLALAGLRNLPAWPTVIAGPRRITATRALSTRSLGGRRVGIHGFGHVARALVRILRPFDVSVTCYSAAVPPGLMRDLGVQPADSLEGLFAASEVLFECEALTPETAGSVSARVLARLKEGAVFVNVGRGEVVDEAALINEARRGRIRVALDVIAQEPLTPDSAVCEIKEALLSPHIGGPTLDLYPALGDFAVANIERFRAGQPLEGLITLDVFDRST